MEVVVNSGIDQSQTNLSSLLDRRDMVSASLRALHRAVDQASVCNGRSCDTMHRSDVQSKCRVVEPVGHRQGACVVVVIGRSGTVDDHGAHDAIAILRRVVGVVPVISH